MTILKQNNLSRYANGSMVFKTIFMLSVFFVPLILLSTGIVSSIWLLFTLYILSGLGMAGVGMGRHARCNTWLSFKK